MSSSRRYSNIEDSLMSSHDSMKSVEDDEPEWQQNLKSWKSRRHSLTLKERERKEEREVLETNSDKKPTRTFNDILKEKEKRICKQVSEEEKPVSFRWFDEDMNQTQDVDHHHDNPVIIDQNNADQQQHNTQQPSEPVQLKTTPIKTEENGGNPPDQWGQSFTVIAPKVAVKPKIKILMKKSPSYEASNSYSRVDLGRVPSFNERQQKPQEEKITYFHFVASDEAADEGVSEQRITVRRGSKVDLEIQSINVVEKKSRKSSERLVMCVCDQPKEGQGFGFGISGGVDQGKPVIVKHVVSGGLLDILNLQQDDEVIMVNDQYLNRMSHKSIVRILSAAVQSGGLSIKISREGQEVLTGDDTGSISMSSSPMMKSVNHDDIPVRGLVTSQVRKLVSLFDTTLSPVSDPLSEVDEGSVSTPVDPHPSVGGLSDSGIETMEDDVIRAQDIP